MPLPRWAPTVTAPRSRSSPWDGERTATEHGPTAAQSAYPAPMDTVLPSSVDPGDDYLNVSVWAPEGADSLPVMVWIHGGAFVRGANSVVTYDGSAFARDGVVVVGINYRLGVPGFAVLEGAPTNLGLRDQIAALEWVRDNVAVFGGNPDDVTVFGESAGGMSVATLMASPAARGLFHRAVIQSGNGAAVCSLDDARRVSAEIAAHLGVPATAEAFGALDPEEVVAAQTAVALAIQADPDPQRWGASVLRGGLGIMSLFPVIDGEIVPGIPEELIADGAAAGVPLLIGTTRDEFRLFLVPTGIAGGGDGRGATGAGGPLRLASGSPRDVCREPADRVAGRRRVRHPHRRRLPGPDGAPGRRAPRVRRRRPGVRVRLGDTGRRVGCLPRARAGLRLRHAGDRRTHGGRGRTPESRRADAPRLGGLRA